MQIGVQIRQLAEDRFLTRYLVVSDKLQRVVVQGDGLIVYYDYRKGQKCSVPDSIRQRILAMDAAAISAGDL